jgi:hypothetical protein
MRRKGSHGLSMVQRKEKQRTPEKKMPREEERGKRKEREKPEKERRKKCGGSGEQGDLIERG